jgi:lysozyme
VVKDMRDKLIELLTKHEGCILHVYKDSLGIDTIGVGRNIKDRGISIDELQFLGYNYLSQVYEEGISESGARYLLGNDIDIIERELYPAHSCVSDLSETRQIVLLNMAFNLGVPRLCKFYRMWAEIHEKDFDAAADEMLNSVWASQVKSRAYELANMMREG